MRFIIIVAVLVFSFRVSAQTMEGKVMEESGMPLEGAYIANIRSGAHAHTNEDGYFLLANTMAGDSVKVSHVSFAPEIFVFAGEAGLKKIRLVRTTFQLREVVINSNANHLNIISTIDTKTNPVNSSQELLRRVPGLFIGQHAGGGKAEQIFLRGFDIDHGTDINISVDGMPVNMVSHAHGQGYADLHFLIPETVDKIDFDKGPYYADKGNLATAGYVAFQTKERLDHSSLTVEGGKFNYWRALGMFDLLHSEKQSAYVATEYLNTDGYFESPQNFYRLNVLAKYTASVSEKDKISLSFSHLASKWNASGQIPQRAVDAGLITRFGSIDNTEGGNTQRTNLNLQHLHYFNNSTHIQNSLFYSRYAFELYSNFTFFLNNPVNGDQIRQKENRDIVGFESVVTKQMTIGNTTASWRSGIGLRYDMVNDIELSHTLNRKTIIDPVKLGDINESNLYAYSGADIKIGKWIINPAIRIDKFMFDYTDKLAATYQNPSAAKAIISPKLNFIYNKSNDLQYFLKLGKGFHSNDTRVIVEQTGRNILPAAYGADAGLTWKPVKNLIINTALWYLYLQQEFVYVGDEGIVEPGGKTGRKGIDLGLRWQPGKYVFLNSDFTYTIAKALEEEKGNDYIPLASKFTLAGGISFKSPSGFAGSVRTRYLGHRPANEDNSIIAKGYCVTDMNLNYSCRQFTFGIVTENLFNTKWNETQFATTSRLYNEPEPVTEIHFTPGTPFNLRGTIMIKF